MHAGTQFWRTREGGRYIYCLAADYFGRNSSADDRLSLGPQYTRCQYIPFTVRCMGPWAHTLPYRYLRKIRASVPCGTFTFGDLGTPIPYPYLGTEGNRIQFPPTVQTP